MSLDLTNVSTKFQLDWQANNRIIAGSCFLTFLGLCFPTFKNVEKYRYGCQGNQVFIFRRWVLTSIMSPPSFNLIGQQTTELLQGLCFLTFKGLCLRNFQKAVEHSYMTAMVSKFLYLKDVS